MDLTLRVLGAESRGLMEPLGLHSTEVMQHVSIGLESEQGSIPTIYSAYSHNPVLREELAYGAEDIAHGVVQRSGKMLWRGVVSPSLLLGFRG